jgi:hypothetical protein
MGADAKVPLAHRLKYGHLLDVVRVEVLELYVNNTPRMNQPAGTEKPRSRKATNDTTYPAGGRGMDSSAGTIHSTVSVRGGSWPTSTRRRSFLWETLERVQFDITTVRSWASWKRRQRQCCGCGRTRSAKGKRERKKKQMGRQSP